MKVRIKMKSKPGDQVDYALATGPMYGHINDYAYSDKDPDVKDTLSAVKRSEANIEAEGGETALGDFNNDGMLEHSKIRGKRHHEGGVPLNVPGGTFLFSDTSKLKIKDKAILDYFNNKRPATPATIAKKYDLNKYNEIFKDPEASRLDKETAQRMISSNTRKLAELSLLQESMKGLPNGVPSFVESVMGGLEQAQHGGFITSDKNLPKFQNAGQYSLKNNLKRMSDQEGPVGWMSSAWRYLRDTPPQNVSDPLYSKTPLRTSNPVKEEIVPFTETMVPSNQEEIIDSLVPLNNSTFYQRTTPVPKVTALEDPTLLMQDVTTNQQVNQSPVTSRSNNSVSKKDPIYDYLKVLGNVYKDRTDLILPSKSYSQFGSQSMGESGVYTTGEDLDMQDFIKRHGKFIESKLGISAEDFLLDIKNPSVRDKRVREFQEKYDQYHLEKTGKTYFAADPTSPYGRDSKFGIYTWSAPGFNEITTNTELPAVNEETPVTTTQTSSTEPEFNDPSENLGIQPGFASQGRKVPGGYFLPDSMSIVESQLDRVRTYAPIRQQVDLEAPDATYLDPSRQIAAGQEQSARYQDVAMNTADGQVARANILANTGQTATQIADLLANYENQNVQIANTNAAQRAEVENNERMANVQMDDTFNQRLAIMNQQRDNALRELKNRRFTAWKHAESNRMKKSLMDQVLFPNFAMDPVSYEVMFTGANGRSAVGNDFYMNPLMGGRTNMDPTTEAMGLASNAIRQKKQLMEQGFSEKDAQWALQYFGRNVRTNPSSGSDLYDIASFYNEML